MPGDLESLKEMAERLSRLGAGHDAIAARASRIAERIGAGAFHIAVLGEFKRGKSTLVNALLERAILPTGVVPLTAVSTEIHYGLPGAVVVHQDGQRREIDLGDVARFVTEPANPSNRLGVARAELSVDAGLLKAGMVLVDTPGTASVYAHNTEAALEAFADADGAIVVLSVDSPVTEDERQLLQLLAERSTRTFVVVNKVDHLAPTELAEVRMFMERQVAGVLGEDTVLYFVSARRALDDLVSGIAPADAGEFTVFLSALKAFVDDELLDARITIARQELARLGTELREAVTVEEAAAELSVEELRARVSRFRAAAAAERQALGEDQVLLDHATARLATELAKRLAEQAGRASERFMPLVEARAAVLSRGHLEDGLHEEVERCVRDGFEEIRQGEAEQAEQTWQKLAQDFRLRTQTRVDAVRQAAADLFDVHLPQLTVPAVAEERERFFYLFVRIEGLGSGVGRVMRLLMPLSMLRRRSLVRAAEEMTQEFDKHAGRARWDLSQRLDQVRLRFAAAMRSEVERAEEGILQAAASAEALLGQSSAEQVERRTALAGLVQLGVEAEHLAGDAHGGS